MNGTQPSVQTPVRSPAGTPTGTPKGWLPWVLLGITSLIASCGRVALDATGDPVRFPRTIADEVGFEIRQKAKPSRIGSVDLMSDEILLDMVGTDRMIVVSIAAEDPSISNVVEKADKVPLRITFDLDRVIESKPDITFLPSWTGATMITKLRARHIPVYYSDPPTDIEGIQAKIRGFAFAVGEPEKGVELITWMDEILAEVASKTSGLSDSERHTVIYYNSVALRVMGKNTTFDDMALRAGLVNAAKNMEADKYGYVYATWDDVKKMDPDIILLPGRVADDPAKARKYFDEVMADATLKSMRAFKNGKVSMADERHISTNSHYIVLGVRDLALLAYPELFK